MLFRTRYTVTQITFTFKRDIFDCIQRIPHSHLLITISFSHLRHLVCTHSCNYIKSTQSRQHVFTLHICTHDNNYMIHTLRVFTHLSCTHSYMSVHTSLTTHTTTSTVHVFTLNSPLLHVRLHVRTSTKLSSFKHEYRTYFSHLSCTHGYIMYTPLL